MGHPELHDGPRALARDEQVIQSPHFTTDRQRRVAVELVALRRSEPHTQLALLRTHALLRRTILTIGLIVQSLKHRPHPRRGQRTGHHGIMAHCKGTDECHRTADVAQRAAARGRRLPILAPRTRHEGALRARVDGRPTLRLRGSLKSPLPHRRHSGAGPAAAASGPGGIKGGRASPGCRRRTGALSFVGRNRGAHHLRRSGGQRRGPLMYLSSEDSPARSKPPWKPVQLGPSSLR